jgi:hypothetical protein
MKNLHFLYQNITNAITAATAPTNAVTIRVPISIIDGLSTDILDQTVMYFGLKKQFLYNVSL